MSVHIFHHLRKHRPERVQAVLIHMPNVASHTITQIQAQAFTNQIPLVSDSRSLDMPSHEIQHFVQQK